MADPDAKFVEAPPLPRYPTVIAEAADGATGSPALADTSPTHLAPPKFPSLNDVDVNNAIAAADAQVAESPRDYLPNTAPVIDGMSPGSSFTGVPAASAITQIETPGSSFTAPPHTAGVTSDGFQSMPVPGPPVGRELERDIVETIRRDRVEPGAAVRRAEAAASKQWSSMDQRHLNALLRDAASGPGADDAAGGAYPTSSIAARVAALNTAVDMHGSIPNEEVDISPAKAQERALSVDEMDDLVPGAGDTLSDRRSPVRNQQGLQRPGDDFPAVAARSARAPLPRAKTVPAGSPAFPAPLATVPMVLFDGPGSEAQAEDTLAAAAAEAGVDAPLESDLSTRHEVMVRSESTNARVNITGDFGLKMGHVGIVRDSAFLDDETLLTAGEDGKVCMWDLAARFVKSYFMPYNGNPVQMLKPIVETNGSVTRSLITLSDDRLMRVWNLVDGQAVLLRSMQIPASSRDLVMSVPVLTPQMKAHAAAAAAAAAVAPTDESESAPTSLDLSALAAQAQADAAKVDEGNTAPIAPGMTKPYSYTGERFKARKSKMVASS